MSQDQVSPMLAAILDAAIKRDATDIHIRCGRKPVLRVNQALVEISEKEFDTEMVRSIVQQIIPAACQKLMDGEQGGTDFAYPWKTPEGTVRFRASAFREQGNPALVLRRLPHKIIPFDDLNLPPIVRELVRRPKGFFLVTGPTGSGKTTTLASMLSYLAATEDRHIIMTEEPTEYQIPHGRSIVTQREVPTDVPTFQEGLRQALRQNPNVIEVGEMRDLETTRTALQAAETGHLVFATLHTQSAISTIDRLVGQFRSDEQPQVRLSLSTSLLAVLCQQLLPRTKGGLVAAYEFMVVTPFIQNCIRTGQTERIQDIQYLDDHLFRLEREGVISTSVAIQRANQPEQLRLKLRNAAHKG